MKNMGLMVAALSLAGMGCARPGIDGTSPDDASVDGPNTVVGPVAWPIATMSYEQNIAITATDTFGPATGVTAILRRSGATDAAPAKLWQGQSDATGKLSGTVVVTPDDGQLELVLTRPGYTGPYTNPSLRAVYGEFAPAAWLFISPKGLDGLDVSFERNAQ
jgi:hypothetical protein